MVKRTITDPRPVSRLLHHPALRTEILDKLQDRWPVSAKSSAEAKNELWESFALPLPDITSYPATQKAADAALPKRLQAESFDLPNLQLEAIIRPLVRPVLYIQDNNFGDSPLEYWNERLRPAHSRIEEVIPAVGRVELKNHDLLDWNGTAWLVRPNVAVTNAHVAKAFCNLRGEQWVFRTNAFDKLIQSCIDYRVEYRRSAEEEVKVLRIIHVQDDERPDVALLEVERDSRHRPVITLATTVAGSSEVVALGYPKFDSSVPEPDVLLSVFGGVYNVKRLSPGVITAAGATVLKHDCSTLGGSSGSLIIDILTGNAVGLHFGGSYKVDNFAVPAPLVADIVARYGL